MTSPKRSRLHLLILLCYYFVACGDILSLAHAERDFNTNDSKVPLAVEPEAEAAAHRPQPVSLDSPKCGQDERDLLLTLVYAKEKNHSHTATNIAKILNVPKENIDTKVVGKGELKTLAGKSLQKWTATKRAPKKVTRATIEVGCGEHALAKGNETAEQIKASGDKKLSEALLGWFIYPKRHHTRVTRRRREIEASGDDDYDYEYEDSDEPVDVTTLPPQTQRHNHASAELTSSTTTQSTDNNDLISSQQTSSTTTSEPTSTTTNSDSSSSTVTTTTTTTTTTARATTTTEYVEPIPENQAPIIKTRLPKVPVTSGKAFVVHVPENTFDDNEDHGNLRLHLTDKDGHELKPSSWLQFNAEKREIYGLPLDDAVSRWHYQLTATDSANASVTEIVEISVQQHRGLRTVNHEINIAVRILDKQMRAVDWQLALLQAITAASDDDSNKWIVVREIRPTPGDPLTVTLVYYNETLLGSECPEAELNELVQQLDVELLGGLLGPELSVKSVNGQLAGPCRKSDMASAKPTSPTSRNLPPVLRNQVDRVNATVGHLLVYKVPSDTFYDPNGGELTLTLKTKDLKELSPQNWLQFDSKNEEFYGVPRPNNVGAEEFVLVAENSAGLTATDALIVVVSSAPKRDYAISFKARLGIRHEAFQADLQRKFIERLAKLHGDADTSSIHIRHVTTAQENDVPLTYVSFSNTTLQRAGHRCPEPEIAATRSVYFNGEGVLRERVRMALGVELNLQNVTEARYGSCNPHSDSGHANYPAAKPDEPTLKSAFSEDFIITFVLPAIIILLMIILASLIACCLHRRRHKSGKMELGDEEERRSFRTKGIPVIFQDELDEKPEIGNKSPIILKDEKPPLLPPSYNTSNMNGDNDVDEYVPPPAVVVGGREARGKSPATPSYRKPPPYVSP